MKPNRLELRIIQILVIAAFLILGIKYFDILLAAVGRLWGIVFPLVIGAVIAFILNIPMKKLEKHYFPNSTHPMVIRTRRSVCLLLSIVFILLVAAFVIGMIIPELINAFSLIIREAIAYLQLGQDWLMEHSNELPAFINQFIGKEIDVNDTVRKLINFIFQGLSGILGSAFTVFGSLAGSVMDGIFAVIFALYLLFGKETLIGQLHRLCNRYIGKKFTLRIQYISRVFNTKFQNFIIGQCLEAIILGVLCTLGMALFRFPYALMVGATIAATALIPILGAYLGAGIGAFMIFTENPIQALGFIVFIIVLQQLEGNLIYPKTVGSSIGLPGIWVIAAVTVGGGFAGIPGMLVGVPLTASVYQFICDDIHRAERKNACILQRSVHRPMPEHSPAPASEEDPSDPENR